MREKKGLIMFLALFFILCFGIPILARIFRETIELYRFDFSLFPSNYIKDITFNLETYRSFVNFTNPINGLGLAIIIIFLISYIINELGLFKVKDKYEQLESYGSHGTSRWQSDKEIKDNYYKDNLGWFLGTIEKNKTYDIGMKAAYHPVNGELNMQQVVIGPPGSNKTTGFVLNNIFHICNVYKDKNEKADIIITDPKSELYSLTADYLEKNGYDVKVLDFIHLTYGDCLNPLDFINDDKSLMEIAKGYIDSVESSNGDKASGDMAFWNNQEAQLLAALIGFVKQAYPKEKQTFSEIAQILTSEDVSDIDNARYFFEDNNIKGAARQLWNNFLMLAESERTRSNILGGLSEKLKLFSIKGIENITSRTTVDIDKLGIIKYKPMTLFILIPDSDRTFAPVINAVVNTIFKQLYKTAYNTKNKLEFPVYFLLEEMANIGKIPGIQEMLGTMRGRRIYPMMIWQSLSQMKDRYGDKGFEDIMSMCDTHVYLGVNDQFTAKYCSDSLGNTTIKVQGLSQKSEGGLFSINEKSGSENYQQRNLLMIDECMRLDNKKMIIRQRAKNPILINKVQYKYWEYNLCESKEIFNLRTIEENEEFKEDNLCKNV